MQYGNNNTKCYAVKATRKQLTVTMGRPRNSYNVVMTAGHLLAIRPTYSHY